MPRTLLCTTGTSIAQGCGALRELQARPTSWDDDVPLLAQQIQQRLDALDLASEGGRIRASAELNALHRLGLRVDDEVVLFATDTADGRCCAQALRAALTSRHIGLAAGAVQVERVPGLQVFDADHLRREGLTHLTRRMIAYLDDPQRRHGGGCVLCPNGGFKGVVPFVTLAGMIFRAPVVYVFEFSDALITLPPLPLGLATDLFERALPALRWARAQGVFGLQPFFQRIAGFQEDERELFNGFLEVEADGALATLSPLADVLTQREGDEQSEVRVSPLAAELITKLDGPALREFHDHLRKVASPLWRSQHGDTKVNSDLEFYPRGHNPWRLAGFVQDGLFNLCWFAWQKGDYLRSIPMPERQRAAFASAEFRPYMVPQPRSAKADQPPADADADLSWLDLRYQRDALRAELEAARNQLEAERARALRARQREHQEHSVAIARLQRELDAVLQQQGDPLDLVVPSTPQPEPYVLAMRTLCEEWRHRPFVARLAEEQHSQGCWIFETADEDGPQGVDILVLRRHLPQADTTVLHTLVVRGHDGRHLQAMPTAADDSRSGADQPSPVLNSPNPAPEERA
ncbi:putative CRISPR-associated protein [Hydrogenophaga sp. NH-16]|uniref:putative CRISPR-associated protein n=1 Tax=Hydrogenophaga sp. NH-16 TaxID=2184519 RepID=UPI000FD8E91F|nr:putative CRISPR-associated protein [Hydrogenophaga sp. NH-16]